MNKKICVMGLGYIGLPTTTLLAIFFYKLIQKDKNTDIKLNKLFKFIQNNKLVRVSDFNVTTRTMEKWMKQLREKNKIEYRIYGYWKIVDAK